MPLSHSTFQHTPTIAVTHLTRSLQPSPPWLCLPLCSDGPSSPHPLALLSLTHQLALSLWLLQNGFYRLVYELVRLDHAVVALTHRSQWLHTCLLFGRSLCFQVWVIILSGSSPPVTCMEGRMEASPSCNCIIHNTWLSWSMWQVKRILRVPCWQ